MKSIWLQGITNLILAGLIAAGAIVISGLLVLPTLATEKMQIAVEEVVMGLGHIVSKTASSTFAAGRLPDASESDASDRSTPLAAQQHEQPSMAAQSIQR